MNRCTILKSLFLVVLPSLPFLYSCQNLKNKNVALLADREAPLGWVYLNVYEDNSFEFISRGLRDKQVYPGTVKKTGDTLFFNYLDSIPKAGKTAIITDQFISYIDGEYPESMKIKLNKLVK